MNTPDKAATLAALRQLSEAVDEDENDFESLVRETGKLLQIDMTKIQTRNDLSRLLSEKIATLIPAEEDHVPVNQGSVEEKIRRHFSQRITAHPEQLKIAFLATLPTKMRNQLYEKVQKQAPSPAAETNPEVSEADARLYQWLRTLHLDNLKELDGIYLTTGIDTTINKRKKPEGISTRHVIFSTKRTPPVAVFVDWYKNNRASKASTVQSLLNNCRLSLNITDMYTNEHILELGMLPHYTQTDKTRSTLFHKSGEYAFATNALAARINEHMQAMGLKMPKSDDFQAPPRPSQNNDDEASAWRRECEKIEQRCETECTLARLEGGEVFKQVWTKIPWEEELRRFVQTDLDTLLKDHQSYKGHSERHIGILFEFNKNVRITAGGLRGSGR